jgi:hypothetical protein
LLSEAEEAADWFPLETVPARLLLSWSHSNCCRNGANLEDIGRLVSAYDVAPVRDAHPYQIPSFKPTTSLLVSQTEARMEHLSRVEFLLTLFATILPPDYETDTLDITVSDKVQVGWDTVCRYDYSCRCGRSC